MGLNPQVDSPLMRSPGPPSAGSKNFRGCHWTCCFFSMFFNMLYFFSTRCLFIQHAFQVFFCISFNMLDSAWPFFNVLFHSLNMPFVPAAISTCSWDSSSPFFNMPFFYSFKMPFVSAAAVWTCWIQHLHFSTNVACLFILPLQLNIIISAALWCKFTFCNMLVFIPHAVVNFNKDVLQIRSTCFVLRGSVTHTSLWNLFFQFEHVCQCWHGETRMTTRMYCR